MRADYRQQAVAFQKLTHAFVCIEERATPGVVMHEVLWAPLLPKTLDGVRPQYVAHESGGWRLTEPVQLRNTPRTWAKIREGVREVSHYECRRSCVARGTAHRVCTRTVC